MSTSGRLTKEAPGAAAPARSAPATGRRRPPRSTVRRALLDAAAELFARRGIDGASVDDVATAAGFTKGAVYSNFTNKDGLVDALVEDRTTSYLAVGLEAVDLGGSSLAAKARALGDRLVRASDEQRDWHLLFVELWQRAVRDREQRGPFVSYRDQLHRGITEAIEAHTSASSERTALEPADLATVVMALANGLAMERLLSPAHVPDRLLGEVLTLLVGPGVGPTEPGSAQP